ncbi:MAG: hypothetical protein ACI9K2_005504, partial [Myxococcota bacterium]
MGQPRQPLEPVLLVGSQLRPEHGGHRRHQLLCSLDAVEHGPARGVDRGGAGGVGQRPCGLPDHGVQTHAIPIDGGDPLRLLEELAQLAGEHQEPVVGQGEHLPGRPAQQVEHDAELDRVVADPHAPGEHQPIPAG